MKVDLTVLGRSLGKTCSNFEKIVKFLLTKERLTFHEDGVDCIKIQNQPTKMQTTLEIPKLRSEFDTLMEKFDAYVEEVKNEEEGDGYNLLEFVKGGDYEKMTELKAVLLELSEVDDSTDFIHEEDFVEHTEEEAETDGFDPNAWWAEGIDWEAAAEKLKEKYEEIEYNGNTFYYRKSE